MQEGHKRLIHIISAAKWGEEEKYAFDICRHFMGEGWNVTAVTRDAKAVDSNLLPYDIPLSHAPVGDPLSLTAVRMLAGILRHAPVEDTVIHVHNSADALTAAMARLWSRRRDVAIVLTHHRPDSPPPAIPLLHAPLAALYNRLMRSIDCHIYPSADSLRMSRLDPLPSADIRLIPTSVLTDYDAPIDEPQRGPVTAMYQGELIAGKGVETIIDALALVSDLRMRLRIVGTGNPDYIDSLRRRAMTRGVMEKIDWTRDTDATCQLIPYCHFGVVADTRSGADTIINKEFMALSRPQICTALGSQNEYITSGVEALIIPPADPPAMAEAMRRLVADPSLRREMGHAAFRSFSSRLSWKTFISQLRDAYTDATRRRN